MITTQLASIAGKKAENGVIYLMCDNIGHAYPSSNCQTVSLLLFYRFSEMIHLITWLGFSDSQKKDVKWNEIQSNWKYRRIKNQALNRLTGKKSQKIVIIFEFWFLSHDFYSLQLNQSFVERSAFSAHVIPFFSDECNIVSQQRRVHLFKIELFDIGKDPANATHEL